MRHQPCPKRPATVQVSNASTNTRGLAATDAAGVIKLGTAAVEVLQSDCVLWEVLLRDAHAVHAKEGLENRTAESRHVGSLRWEMRVIVLWWARQIARAEAREGGRMKDEEEARLASDAEGKNS